MAVQNKLLRSFSALLFPTYLIVVILLLLYEVTSSRHKDKPQQTGLLERCHAWLIATRKNQACEQTKY